MDSENKVEIEEKQNTISNENEEKVAEVENPTTEVPESLPQEKQNPNVDDDLSSSTYLLKYNRKINEPRESTYDKELIKSDNCVYMIEFKIINLNNEKYLLVYCHEIAAIYFDEIYEKKYSINDLYTENKYFKVFDEVDGVKSIIDELLKNNTKNTKKIYIDFNNFIFRLHLKFIFFDKESEVTLNIPQKKLTDDERIDILPAFLKEIQIKMTHLEEENKKLKDDGKFINNNMINDMDSKYDTYGSYENENDEQESRKANDTNEMTFKKKKIKNKGIKVGNKKNE